MPKGPTYAQKTSKMTLYSKKNESWVPTLKHNIHYYFFRPIPLVDLIVNEKS